MAYIPLLRDDAAPHQLRLVQQGNRDVFVSCTCRRNPDGWHEPLGTYPTAGGVDPMLTCYYRHLKETS